MKYFGITIKEKNPGFDVQEVIARMFLSPRYTRIHVERTLHFFAKDKSALKRFINQSDHDIKRLHERIDDENTSLISLLSEKVEEWESQNKKAEKGISFLSSTKVSSDDYKYLMSKFNFSDSEIYGLKITSPKEMADIVKQYIKGQDLVIEKLAVHFFMHLECIKKNLPYTVKSSPIVIGATGVGKTETYRRFARLCGDCPVIRINTSEITPTGWKGQGLEDILYRAIEQYGLEKMKHAIIVFNEIDKIVHHGARHNGEKMESDMDFTRDIMRLFETEHELTINCPAELIRPADLENQSKGYKLPLEDLLIVFDGAFYGLSSIVAKRIGAVNKIGYGNEQKRNVTELLKKATFEDLKTFGFPDELIGRIGNLLVMNDLTSDVIYEIMVKSKSSIVKDHQKYFQEHNVHLDFDDDALKYIADEASKSKLGFRCVNKLLHQSLYAFYYETGDSNKERTVKITREYLERQLKFNQ